MAGIGAASVPTEVRQAMLTLFRKAAYIETGLADEVAVVQAWAEATTAITVSPSTASVSSASPTAQLSAVTTPAGGAVTWASSNTAVATVSSAGLVTAVGNGTATITATSGAMSASCAVTVTGFRTLTGITATYTQSGTVYDTDSLDDLKADLVVTASYDDSGTETITDYTLSGTLGVGTSTITVSYGGFTDTFTVTVTSPYWDYEWSATSKTLPDGMTGTYHDFTTEADALYIENPELKLDYIGNMRWVMECKMYSINKDLGAFSYRNNPQLTLVSVYAEKGCKLVGTFGNATSNPDGNLAIAINGVNTILSGAEGMTMHEYDLTQESGVATLLIDGVEAALTQNEGTSQYLKETGISSSLKESDAPLYGIMVIKSLKYKKL
jgi:hypothetical protein